MGFISKTIKIIKNTQKVDVDPANTQKYSKVSRSPNISDFADFRPRYLRAQKELGAKSGIYDCVLSLNFHVNKFLERLGTFFVPKNQILKKVPK